MAGSLFGPKSGGVQRGNIKGAPGALGSGLVDHSQSGSSDVVRDRVALASQGKMLKDQMKKNKSSGLKP